MPGFCHAFEGPNVAACTTHEIHLTPVDIELSTVKPNISWWDSCWMFWMCWGCREAQKVKAWQGDVLVSKIANDLTTPTIHPKQATQIAKTWVLKKMVEILEFEDSLAIKQENWKLYLSHKTILPRKHTVAANKSQLLISNLQEIGDTWATVIVKTYKACSLLSFWRMSTTAVQILHFGQGRLRLFSGRCMSQRPNPESQNMALIGTRQLCSSSHGKIQNKTKKQKSRNQENDGIHLQTPLHHPL